MTTEPTNTLLLDQDLLQHLSGFDRLFVGFSGGLDSTVLLHYLASLPRFFEKLQAIHVNHGLSLNASDWQAHCQAFCDKRSIRFHVRQVSLESTANLEAAARDARYQAFASFLSENDGLLLAHHRDDQAETLLLQLFRGAGIDGMSAMAPMKPFAKGVLVRPFLAHSRQQLELYAIQNQLEWIEDESNTNESFSRNYLRHQVLPILQVKWPHVVENLVRSVSHCQEAKLNLEALAEIDYKGLRNQLNTLPLHPILMLARSRQKNVVRFWLKNNGLRYPSQVLLNNLFEQLIDSRNDAMPSVALERVVIHRYQQVLYLCQQSVEAVASLKGCIDWILFPQALRLSSQSRCVAYADGKGIFVPEGASVQIRFRQGGRSFIGMGKPKH